MKGKIEKLLEYFKIFHFQQETFKINQVLFPYDHGIYILTQQHMCHSVWVSVKRITNKIYLVSCDNFFSF